jgi:hypothetical protein
MSTASYMFGILAAVLALSVVVELLRRRRLRERHAVWWLFAGTVALVVGVFPQVVSWASAAVGIEVPTNLVFFVTLTLLVLVGVQHSAELTDLESKTRLLAEHIALQGNRIDVLEHRLSARSPGANSE